MNPSKERPVRVALAQIDPPSDDLAAALVRHVACVEQATAAGADLIVFPELSLTGDDPGCEARSAEEQEMLVALSREIDIVVGLKERGEGRSAFYNSAFYFSRGRLAHRHRKLFLLDYGPWDEGRRLTPGDQLRVVDTALGRLAVLICNDVWHAPAPYLAALDGAEFLIVPANSARGSLAESLDIATTWEQMNRAYAAMMGFYLIFVNRVGVMGAGPAGYRYWGGSEIVGPDGRPVVKAPYDAEALVIGELDRAKVASQRRRAPLIRDTRPQFFEEAFGRLAREQGALAAERGNRRD